MSGDLIGALDEVKLSRFHLRAALVSAMGFFTDAFGRIADVVGRKKVYWLVAAVMAVAAIGSALAPSRLPRWSACAAGCQSRRGTRSRFRAGAPRRPSNWAGSVHAR